MYILCASLMFTAGIMLIKITITKKGCIENDMLEYNFDFACRTFFVPRMIIRLLGTAFNTQWGVLFNAIWADFSRLVYPD